MQDSVSKPISYALILYDFITDEPNLKIQTSISNLIFLTRLYWMLKLNRTVKASVTIMADFSPEFDPPVRWRSKHQTKNDC